MTWDEVKSLSCQPQSLIGWGDVHKRSKGTCLYCGFGILSGGNSETKFDMWRQFTVEHIVPAKNGELNWKIKEAVNNFFPDEQSGTIKKVKNMNEITSCHVCNSFVSRCSSAQNINNAIRCFHGHLADRNKNLQTWLKQLRDDIWEVWKLKSARARGKLVYLRKKFIETIGDDLNVVLVESRNGLSPDELDGILKGILDGILPEQE